MSEKKISVDKEMSLALEMCEDWKPTAYWESKEINFIWFSEKQLKNFIKQIKQSDEVAV